MKQPNAAAVPANNANLHSVGREHCFACGRVIRHKVPFKADTRDAQIVYVGPECFKLVAAAGEAGYQPPKGGPRLYPVAAPTTAIF